MLPTFIVIGAMKAGTTSLYAMLAKHPEVFMARPKELDFFVASKRFELGESWYRARFADAGEAVARGEVSPSYTKADSFAGVPARMAAMVPDARLVYLVRDPIDRMRSMYLHEVAAGREHRDIEAAFREDRHYLNTSRYAWQLEHYRDHFPREAIAVVTFEEMREGGPGLPRILRHIGVDPSLQPAPEHLGRTSDRRLLPASVQRLRRHRLVDRATAQLPGGVRRVAGRLLRRPAGAVDTAITDDLRRELSERLAPDMAELAAWVEDPSFDGWGLLTTGR